MDFLKKIFCRCVFLIIFAHSMYDLGLHGKSCDVNIEILNETNICQ